MRLHCAEVSGQVLCYIFFISPWLSAHLHTLICIYLNKVLRYFHWSDITFTFIWWKIDVTWLPYWESSSYPLKWYSTGMLDRICKWPNLHILSDLLKLDGWIMETLNFEHLEQIILVPYSFCNLSSHGNPIYMYFTFICNLSNLHILFTKIA